MYDKIALRRHSFPASAKLLEGEFSLPIVFHAVGVLVSTAEEPMVSMTIR
jgi:hypothetical protein